MGSHLLSRDNQTSGSLDGAVLGHCLPLPAGSANHACPLEGESFWQGLPLHRYPHGSNQLTPLRIEFLGKRPRWVPEVKGGKTLKHISHISPGLALLWISMVLKEHITSYVVLWQSKQSKIDIFTVSNAISLNERNLSIWQEAWKSVNIMWMSW